MAKDMLGDRMKHNYEEVSAHYLTRRTPVIIRLDGVAFHTFTRGFKKPFDDIFIKTMQQTMQRLCEEIQGCVLGYTQSDEISLLLIDYKRLNSSAWFDYRVQKLVSVSASMASCYFQKYFVLNVDSYLHNAHPDSVNEANYLSALRSKKLKSAFFDARAFNVPREEVTNYFLWRQLDAERNSVLSLSQSLYSQKTLQGLSVKELITKMENEAGIVWGELPTVYKRGSCCIKTCLGLKDTCDETTLQDFREGKILCPHLTDDMKTGWVIDNGIPRFKDEGRGYIEKLLHGEEE